MVATVDALVDQLAVMRGAAMKAGQVLSTIEFPGLEPDQAAYLQGRLASLRDSVAPVDWNRMRRVLESAWGQPAEGVLETIDTQPAAAASIGQVYRGRTQDGAGRRTERTSRSRSNTRGSRTRSSRTCATSDSSRRCCAS
jgi:predicted unusual protein kinase regulating ubiquinone biosynthesis (AarF/ABC1/UbiB family)